METSKDLFVRIKEAIENNPNLTVCHLRTFRRELVDIRDRSSDDFKRAVEEIEQELKGDDEALFNLVMGGRYNKGVQLLTFQGLLCEYEADKKDGIVQRVELQVAPTTGLYLPDELQAFMMGLIPGITPDFVQNFEYGNEKLQLGKVGLYEKIGEMKRRVREERTELILDSTFRSLLSDKVMGGQRIIEDDKEEVKEFYRVITLEVFPDIEIAKKLSNTPANTISYQTIIEAKPELRLRIDDYVRSLPP